MGKRFLLVRPRDFVASGVQFYPSLHPQDRQVMNWLQPTEERRNQSARMLSVVLDVGDVLFVPSYVIHHTEVPLGKRSSVSQNVWWKGLPEMWNTRNAYSDVSRPLTTAIVEQ